MREILQMDRIMEKLTILSAAARYDVACTSKRGAAWRRWYTYGKRICKWNLSCIYRGWALHFTA